MRNKLLRFGNVGFWISFLIILLVVLNLIMFNIYQQAHISENLSVQLWKYFESATFKVVAASLILPILLFLLESRFKIAETMKKDRLDRPTAGITLVKGVLGCWFQQASSAVN